MIKTAVDNYAIARSNHKQPISAFFQLNLFGGSETAIINIKLTIFYPRRLPRLYARIQEGNPS